jgi:hypothetical protein
MAGNHKNVQSGLCEQRDAGKRVVQNKHVKQLGSGCI